MPAKTDKQAITARIAGAIKKGLQKGKPGEPSTEMAKMPMKSLKKFMHTKKDKKVKNENMGVASMYAVLEATPDMKETDLVVEFNPLEGVQHINVDMNRVVDVFTGADEARAIAAEVYKKCMDEAFQLEEKKGKVGDKLKKTIDHLEKKRKEHLDMAKEDPKNASQHKEHIAKLASQIDDLMSKMERIAKSKKEIEKKEDLKESNKKADYKIGEEIMGTKKNYFLYNHETGKKEGTYKTKEEAQEALDKKKDKKSLDESNFTAELGKTKTGDTTVIVKKDGNVLSFDDQLNLSDKEQDEIKILKAKAVEDGRWRSKNK